MDKQVVFYSWQSDDSKTRNFIKKHLENAIKSLKDNPKLESRPVLDDSTKGKLGAVDIPATISEKISSCDVFVADMSFIGEYNGRKLVNQNVMYELGYMIGRQGDSRIIMLFNADSGDIKDLPFDVSHRRVLPFSIAKDLKGEQLESTLLNILPAYLENSQLIKQMPKNKEIDLDNEEMQLLKLYATIEDSKRIVPTKTAGGYSIHIPDIHDDKMLTRLIGEQGGQKIVANLDDMVNKGILKLEYTQKGIAVYELAKLGYSLIENDINS